MNRGRQLRELMSKGECVIAPGAYDGLTARLVAQAGFASVYMTGGGTSSGFGYPDYGLLTMNEMVENAGRIVDAVDLPVISDADNGYGNELNVYRTIQTFEKAESRGSISRIKYSQKNVAISKTRNWSPSTTISQRSERRPMHGGATILL